MPQQPLFCPCTQDLLKATMWGTVSPSPPWMEKVCKCCHKCWQTGSANLCLHSGTRQCHRSSARRSLAGIVRAPLQRCAWRCPLPPAPPPPGPSRSPDSGRRPGPVAQPEGHLGVVGRRAERPPRSSPEGKYIPSGTPNLSTIIFSAISCEADRSPGSAQPNLKAMQTQLHAHHVFVTLKAFWIFVLLLYSTLRVWK